MITAILATALAIGLPQQQQQTDTTFDVRAGGRLELEALNGAVTIGTWDRSAMRVRAVHRATTIIEIEQDGSEVQIETGHRRGAPDAVTFEITVPRSYNVTVDGVTLPVTIDGVQGEVNIENVEGAIVVRRVTGPVAVESVSGSITVDNVRGALSAATVNQALSISGVRGNIEAETVNGSIVMRGIDAAEVEASTVNGFVEFDGVVRDGGNYYLGTHNGRITMAVPEQANARISIETQNGKVDSAFPVQVRGAGGREFSFTIGSGSARIDLESYNGTIYLVRPDSR